MKHTWLWWKKEDLRTEQQQLVEEGRNTDGMNAEFERLLAPDCPESIIGRNGPGGPPP